MGKTDDDTMDDIFNGHNFEIYFWKKYFFNY